MKRFIFYIIIIAICFGCRSASILPSQFHTDIVVDGIDLEWPTLTKVKYKEKYSYGVYNDYENVYFLFRTLNPRLVKLIFEQGMTLWINGNGGKSKEIGITYLPPPKYRISNEVSNSGGMVENDKEGRIKGILKRDALFEMNDLTEGDMTAALGRQVNGEYVIYEAQFSFNTIRQYALEKNIDKGKLSFTIEFGPMVIRNNDFFGNTNGSSSINSSGMIRSPNGGMYNVIPMSFNEEIYVKSILVKW